ncbi:hypothetical protein GCK32_021681 [Trichostrongylus colubriformis]|uniref:ShKT domain-containing protein n=1 Tax=Trichostrongylus colubriformis TaxID=6319 RepID=A0AAN8FX21_TRICO
MWHIKKNVIVVHSSPLFQPVMRFIYALCALVLLSSFEHVTATEKCADKAPKIICYAMSAAGQCIMPRQFGEGRKFMKVHCKKHCGFC